MQIATAASVQSQLFPNIREGDLNMHDLLWGDPESLANYHAAISTANDEYLVPRHRHNFEQVRYIIGGDVKFGNHDLTSGWVAYFPEGVPYGPQTRKLGMKIFTVQFGGASRNGFVSRKQFIQSSEELKKKGEFEKGSFTYFDAEGKRHRKDSFEAVWEHARGKPLEYPKPRYDDIIVMNPESYEWLDDRKNPGCARKWLGMFTERDSRVGFVQIDKGAVFNAGMHDSSELLFLTKGAVNCGGQDYAQHSAFGFAANEGPKPIKATEASEFFVLHMPHL